jgi:hypothetical protein
MRSLTMARCHVIGLKDEPFVVPPDYSEAVAQFWGGAATSDD